MLVAYIDESYPQPAHTYFVAAAVFDMVALLDLGREFRKTKQYAFEAHGVPLDTELHAHPLMQGRGGWKALGGKHRAQEKIYGMALEGIVNSGARVFIRGINVEAQRRQYINPIPASELALTWVLENVDAYARRKDRKVVVVADQVPEHDDLAASVALSQLTGTVGWKSSKLENITLPIRFEDSTHHMGLQAADLAAYLYQRLRCVQERDARAAAAKKRLWKTLEPACGAYEVWTPRGSARWGS